MGNHVYLEAVPEHKDSLARCIGLAHQGYESAVNPRHGWTDNLWANRYYSSALDDDHLWKVVRYVDLNPVRAGLAADAIRGQWSSARCHAGLEENNLLAQGRPFPGHWSGDWQAFLDQRLSAGQMEWIRQNLVTGRPTGSREFVKALEQQTEQPLSAQKRGPRPAGVVNVDLTEDMFG